MRDGLPKASFIGFTGTPIESGDKNTQAVFGDYIDVYDILQSKEDKATVPIYYEARLAKVDLKPEERPKGRAAPASHDAGTAVGTIQIPTGFRPKAQGCAARATLGHCPHKFISSVSLKNSVTVDTEGAHRRPAAV